MSENNIRVVAHFVAKPESVEDVKRILSDAANVAICSPITDDRELQRSIREIVTTII
jgi:hypothetical protein